MTLSSLGFRTAPIVRSSGRELAIPWERTERGQGERLKTRLVSARLCLARRSAWLKLAPVSSSPVFTTGACLVADGGHLTQ